MKNKRIHQLIDTLSKTSFATMPASTKYHNNKSGGLLDHSCNVWRNLDILTEKLHLEWESPDSPVIIGLLHDACKIDAYFFNPDYRVWEHNPDHPSGHGELSLQIVDELGIALTDEERACIRWHMGAFDEKENWSGFTEAIHKYPNVLWTHVADMMSAHMDEIKEEKR